MVWFPGSHPRRGADVDDRVRFQRRKVEMAALALGGPIAANLWKSLAWLAGIFIVFAPLAVRAYKRAS